MVRLVNERDAPLIDVRAGIGLIRIEDDGTSARRLYDRALAVRPDWPLPAVVDSASDRRDSPLWRQTKASFAAPSPRSWGRVGHRETAKQSVHARSSYRASEIGFDERFAPMYEAIDDGQRIRLYVDRLNDTIPVDADPPGGATR
jgi:inward rectifier potassium channel